MTGDPSLNEEFNKSCDAACASGSNIPFATTKFSLLFTHKAATLDEKRALVSGLLKVGLFWVNRISEDSYRGAVKGGEAVLRPLFNELTAPDALMALPNDAAKQTAEAALKILRRGETLDPGSINQHNNDPESSFENYRACLLTMATIVKESADTFKTELDGRISMSVETANPVTASRPIHLKSTGSAA